MSVNKSIDIDLKHLIEFFDIENITEIEFYSTEFQVVKFKNYVTTRFLELADGFSGYIFNGGHKFIKLIKDFLPHLNNERLNSILEFFYSFNWIYGIKKHFTYILKRQQEILQWFVYKNLIKENEIKKFLLKEDDFPPHMIK